MKKIVKYILVPLFTLTLLFSFQDGKDDNLSVLINSSVPDKEFAVKHLQKVVMGRETRWSDNSVVKLALLKPSSRTGNLTAFKMFFGADGAKMNKYYMKMVFQGKMSSPKFCDTAAELKEYVKNTPGAMGIVLTSELGDFSPVMKIDGKINF